MQMTLPESVPFDWFLVAGAAALVVGVFVGLGLGYVRRVRLEAELSICHADIEARESAEAEREAALALAEEKLRASFGRLANEQFRQHTETFLKLARENLGAHHERAKGELAAREKAIENIVKPIRDALQRTDSQLQELEKARREAQGALQAQIEAMAAGQSELRAETRNLVNALRRPEVRGQWGEVTLRRIVELAGMSEHCDFTVQAHRATENGSIRPDMLIRLPENRLLVVDVKTPLEAYLEAMQAESEADRRAAFARHAAIMAERVRELSTKAYWRQFDNTPEFVILFIPGDQFLSAALSQRPALLDDALRQNIILATPTSLVALLKAVAYGWQQVTLAENAKEIRRLGTQLYERLNSFAAHMLQVGKSLGDGVKAYNRAIGSLERMVLPGARRFTELGVSPRQELTTVPPIEETPRTATMLPDSAPAAGGSESDAEQATGSDAVGGESTDEAASEVANHPNADAAGTELSSTVSGAEADDATDDERDESSSRAPSATERLAISTITE
jgi:DNA recombination protein RmuC